MIRILVLLLLLSPLYAYPSVATNVGFKGSVVAEWLNDSRAMRLTQPLTFISADGNQWHVPGGAVVDGASIPQVFWTIIGSPFSGNYRRASVIHDYFCQKRNAPWRNVHSVFHEAMLASGVNRQKAWVMYKAVLWFGPRWQVTEGCVSEGGHIDFEQCTKNQYGNKPRLFYPEIDNERVVEFLELAQPSLKSRELQELEKEFRRRGYMD